MWASGLLPAFVAFVGKGLVYGFCRALALSSSLKGLTSAALTAKPVVGSFRTNHDYYKLKWPMRAYLSQFIYEVNIIKISIMPE